MRKMTENLRLVIFVPLFLCTLMCRDISPAQTGALNLDFEEGNLGEVPGQWFPFGADTQPF